MAMAAAETEAEAEAEAEAEGDEAPRVEQAAAARPRPFLPPSPCCAIPGMGPGGMAMVNPLQGLAGLGAAVGHVKLKKTESSASTLSGSPRGAAGGGGSTSHLSLQAPKVELKKTSPRVPFAEPPPSLQPPQVTLKRVERRPSETPPSHAVNEPSGELGARSELAMKLASRGPSSLLSPKGDDAGRGSGRLPKTATPLDSDLAAKMAARRKCAEPGQGDAPIAMSDSI